jgi:GNAT superfamily N-acetyltransferase
VTLGQHFLASSTYAPHLTDNPAQMAAMATELIQKDTGVVYVSDRDGVITGMIGMILFRHHLSDDLTAAEVFWFVHEGARGDGLRLLQAAEAWAVTQGAAQIQLVAPSAQVGRIYARRGYLPVETAWQRRIA